MKIYEVLKRGNCSGCTFYIFTPDIGGIVIMSSSPGAGNMIRTDLTTERLKKHLAKMRAEGFKVIENEI